MSPLATSGLAAAAGSIAALTVGVLAMPIGRRLSLLDWPDGSGGRKRHARVTPLVGGIAVAVAALSGAGVALISAIGPDIVHLVALGVAVLAMFVIGAMDDRWHLSPRLRLGLASAVLLAVMLVAPSFTLPGLLFTGAKEPLLLGGGGLVFALLCMVGLLNAVNMADGKNGVVIGQGIIWSLVLIGHAPPALLPVLAALLAALLCLFAFNMAGRLFLGDSGSYALSALIGLSAIAVHNHDSWNLRADEVALLFAVPVLDTVRLMVSRALQRRSPFEADRDHLHHHLHDRFGWPRGLWVYLALVAVPNGAALAWPAAGLWLLGLTAGLYAAMLLALRPAAQRSPAG